MEMENHSLLNFQKDRNSESAFLLSETQVEKPRLTGRRRETEEAVQPALLLSHTTERQLTRVC